MRRAVLLDRDGTVCHEVGYIADAEGVRLIGGSAEAVRDLNRAGFQTVVVTNQAGVGRGVVTEERIAEIHDRLRELLSEHDARLDGIYYCPHHPEAEDERYRRECECRKPGTGLLHRARDEMGIELASSYMVGDTLRDIDAGRRVGATTVLVLTGHGEKQDIGAADAVRPDHVAPDLLGAVRWILEREALAGRPAGNGRTERRP